MKDTVILPVVCPYCGALLEYAEGESFVQCPICDKGISIADAIGGARTEVGAHGMQVAAAVDTAEAALAYLSTYFDAFDAEEFSKTADLYVPHLREMAETCKIRHANSFATWSFEFGSILLPLNAKLDGLSALEAQIAEDISGSELSSYEAFDEYFRLLTLLYAERKNILATLARDITYATEYSSDEDEIAVMKEQLEALRARLEALPPLPADMESIPAVAAKREAECSRKAAELLSVGIDAESTYRNACAALHEKAPAALTLFEQLGDYRDSRAKIAEINRCFNFGHLWCFAGETFIVRQGIFEMEEEQQEAAETVGESSGSHGFSFFSVTAEGATSKPVLKGVTALLGLYGTKLYYICKDASICVYDTVSKTSSELDHAAVGDYVLGKELKDVIVADHGARLYIKKKLDYPERRSGCFAKVKSLFSKKKTVNYDNNYLLLCLNCKTATVEPAVPAMIDVMFAFENKVFYKVSEQITEQKKQIQFRVYDLVKGTSEEVLSEHANIHAVMGDLVVYTLWDPNDLNIHLHVADLSSGIDRLLESNIYDVLRVVNGRIYYTVGNRDSATLFSIDPNGEDRREIMKNAAEIHLVRDNWLYIVKHYGRNSALIKVSVRGGKPISVCTRLWRVIRFVGGHIYYMDTTGNLHVVRSDGTDDRVLAVGLDLGAKEASSIVIDHSHIYYLQREFVGRLSKGINADGSVRYEDRYSHSLYRMDLDGCNLRKIAFNVEELRAFDADTLYVYQNENVTYRVTTPVSKKESRVEIRTYPVKRYMSYDKVTGVLQTVYEEGAPEKAMVKLKGCFLTKAKDAEVTYEPIPTTLQYKTRGKTDVGAVEREKRTQE